VGVVGGGIRADDVTGLLVPAYAALGNAVIARDCVDLATPPWCGCPSTTTGTSSSTRSIGDTGPDDVKDCSISIEEAEAKHAREVVHGVPTSRTPTATSRCSRSASRSRRSSCRSRNPPRQ